jgi:hypothetical protein
MKTIPLSQGKVALVDDEDFEYLNQWKWSAKCSGYSFYAQRMFRINGIRKMIMMHRFILGVEKNRDIDHIDHDGLNNQKRNLRLVTHSQNMANSRKGEGFTSKYKGVSFDKMNGKWVVDIAGKRVGRFADEEEAARAYNEAAKKLYGDFAFLNDV